MWCPLLSKEETKHLSRYAGQRFRSIDKISKKQLDVWLILMVCGFSLLKKELTRKKSNKRTPSTMYISINYTCTSLCEAWLDKWKTKEESTSQRCARRWNAEKEKVGQLFLFRINFFVETQNVYTWINKKKIRSIGLYTKYLFPRERKSMKNVAWLKSESLPFTPSRAQQVLVATSIIQVPSR